MADNIFTTVQVKAPQTSSFDLSHQVKLSMNMGQLIPTLVQEVLPGDRFNISNESLTRFMPLLTPVMHQFKQYTHYFFVPNRVCWKNWEYWIIGQKKTNGVDEYVPPTLEVPHGSEAAIPEGSLWDYMGLPPSKAYDKDDGNDVNSIPFAAYQRIWYEWYRDQNLIDPLSTVDLKFDLVDGVTNAVSSDLKTLRKRAWRHDYFTSALPWPQKGEDVTIPFGEFNDVDVYSDAAGGDPFAVSWEIDGGVPADGPAEWKGGSLVDNLDAPAGPLKGDLKAETSELVTPAPTINELRRAFALQRWMEINARGGTRYIENIRAHFNVRSSDARLQRPEFLGGNISNVVVSEVLQTTQKLVDEGSGVLGSMGGHAVSATEGNNISYFAEEHGFIIGITSILSMAEYTQGIPRHFGQRKDRYDYAWPSLAHLGEQPIIAKELFYSGEFSQSEEDNATFGYIPRYAEYRYNQNRVASALRTTLYDWTYGRIFLTRPFLNSDFIEYSNDNRIFAVTDESEQHIILHMHNIIWANRRLPKYATPI